MDSNKNGSIKLFNISQIDCKDDFDEKLERCHLFVQNIIVGHSEKEAHDELVSTVCKSPISHEEVCVGLLVSILTDSHSAQRYYRDLTYVARDGMTIIIAFMNQIAVEKFHKISETSKNQLLWLVKEMCKNCISGIETVCHNLLRQIVGGDVSPKNLWLAEHMLDIFIETRAWLETINVMIATAVYTYLRLIIDHFSTLYSKLRQKEVDFCISLLREKFTECMGIGRDLIRLLRQVAHIPEFESFWRELYSNPGSLSPGFTGVGQLLKIRTSRRFLQCRITPDMEKKICFLTSQVKFGQQKRYQDWFQKQYLSTSDSQSLRCDVIRFICGVIHPTNEVLCSDIIPRWAVIGWLLSSCTSPIASANAKLSLFFDWLMFDPGNDNIMNIEPAILVMYHSIRSHPVITATLLDFLCRISHNFHPPLAPLVKQGIKTSLHQILEKRVLQSLSPLFDSPKLDRELAAAIRENFPEFCSLQTDGVNMIINMPSGNINDSNNRNIISDVIIDDVNLGNTSMNTNNHHHHNNAINSAKFSDDEDEKESSPIKKKKNVESMKETTHAKAIVHQTNHDLININDHISLVSSDFLPKIDLKAQIEQFDSLEIRKYLMNLYEEKDNNETRCEIMENLLHYLMEQDDCDHDTFVSTLVLCLLTLLEEDLSRKIFPDCVDEESLEDSIGTPLFVMFRNLCQNNSSDIPNPNRNPLLNLLAEMGTNHHRIGYLLLYHLKVSKTYDNKMSSYREFARTMGRDLTPCLLSDLRACQDDDVNMFCYLVPGIYSQFASLAIGNSPLLHMVVSCIDSVQLQDLISHILQADMKMFKKDSIVSILNASLNWETFEQYCLWQLIMAHHIPVDHIIPILPKLEYNLHSEPLTSIMLMLQREPPSANLIKHILSREMKSTDLFVVSVLSSWIQTHGDKLSELINSFLTSKLNSPAKRKRNANNKSSSQANSHIEQALAHLDHLRQKIKQNSFFTQESMQAALTQVQSYASEAQKTKYSDLLAFAEDLDAKPQSKRGKASNAKGKNNNNKVVSSSNANNNSSTDSEASEDEAPPIKQTKQAQSRKKRKQAIGSDSD